MLVWDGRQPARPWVRKQRNVYCWKTLPSTALKTMTEITSHLWSVVTSCVFQSPINPITRPNPVYSHTKWRDNMCLCPMGSASCAHNPIVTFYTDKEIVKIQIRSSHTEIFLSPYRNYSSWRQRDYYWQIRLSTALYRRTMLRVIAYRALYTYNPCF
jgi:hypothetical protein